MNHLVVGMGEVGRALASILDNPQTLDIHEEMIRLPIDVMHVTIPYSDEFIKIVKNYKKKYSPRHTIIYSTVAVGTTAKLGENVAHSPVEGVHPKLDKSFRHFARWVGSFYPDTQDIAQTIWGPITEVRFVYDPSYTEFLKLYSTSKYGVNIAFADYASKWTDRLGMDYGLVKQFDRDYNNLYYRLNKPQYRRYVLDPPKGKIGGHCIVPNADILDSQFPNEMLKEIRKYG